MAVLHRSQLKLGPSRQGGHEVYLDAMLCIDEQPRKKIIFKKNKYHQAQFSRLEVAFSELAQLFLARDLTSPQQLVVNDSRHVIGLVSEHLCYAIARREGLNHPFYTFKNQLTPQGQFQAQNVSQAEKIPFYFLNQLPQGAFAQLINAEKAGRLSIDYASLASVLASSYSLEEDDLHKGNFGFYLKTYQGKPRAVFFKIDHDLMFSNSLVSFYTCRAVHLANDEHSFAVTQQDLVNFPHLHDAMNYYWPTKTSYFTRPWTRKGYRNAAEIADFIALKNNPVFQKAKWLAFYRHLLIPPSLMTRALEKHFDPHNANDRADIALMMQAVVARQAELRAVLFSIPDFRQVIGELKSEEKEEIWSDLLSSFAPEENEERSLMRTKFQQMDIQFNTKGLISAGDSALHVAIKLGDFRYQETLSLYGHLLQKKNQLGQTPLDVVLNQLDKPALSSDDPRCNLWQIAKYLLRCGATASMPIPAKLKKQILSYHAPNPYLGKIKQGMSYQELNAILRDIGEEHRYGLKFKKNVAVACVKRFIQLHQKREVLLQLKEALRHCTNDKEAAGLKYLCQLRSRLWIVRQIRGLYGYTSTQKKITCLLEKALAHSADKSNHRAICSSLFFQSNPTAVPNRCMSSRELSYGQ